jgi:glyoxylase-like metal-dependent hydrolase (beta-lactamase superfamily II)
MLGAIAFADANRPAPQFVASAAFARTLAVREPYYLNALQRDFGIALTHAEIVYPSVIVDTSLDIDLGDRVLTLQAWPTAHTDNDLTVFDRRTRTLFASDLLFVQHLPVLDGNLRGWISVMASLTRLDVAMVVPGHGPVSSEWPTASDAQADYLNALLRDTRAALRSKLTIQQAIERIAVAPGAHWLLTDRFHRRNVTAAYAELEWEDDEPHSPIAPSPAGSSARPGQTGGG